MWIYYVLLTRSSVDGHWGCFHFLAIRNNAAMNIRVQVLVKTYVFSSLQYIPQSRTTGSYAFCLTL